MRESHPPEQVSISRIVAELVEIRKNLEGLLQRSATLLKGSFEPGERLIFVPESRVDVRDPLCSHFSSGIPVLKFFHDSKGLGTPPSYRITVSERGRAVKIPSCPLLKLCNRFLVTSLLQIDLPQNPMRGRIRVEFSDLSALINCRIELTSHHIDARKIRTDDRGKRIEFLSATVLANSLVGPTHDFKPDAIPLVRRGVIRIQLDCALVFPFGLRPLPRPGINHCERGVCLRK